MHISIVDDLSPPLSIAILSVNHEPISLGFFKWNGECPVRTAPKVQIECRIAGAGSKDTQDGVDSTLELIAMVTGVFSSTKVRVWEGAGSLPAWDTIITYYPFN